MSNGERESAIQPIPADQEFTTAQDYSGRGSWEVLNSVNFPYLAENMPVMLAQFKINAIKTEVGMLQDYVGLVGNNEEAIDLLQGRMTEMQASASETIIELYKGKVEPVKRNAATLGFTRDDAAWIQFVQESGAVDLLDPKIIPSLANLSDDEIRQMKLEALSTSYTRWRELKNINFDGSVDTGLLAGNNPNALREYAAKMQDQVLEKILGLAGDGLQALTK
jgi:hypothetical protein